MSCFFCMTFYHRIIKLNNFRLFVASCVLKVPFEVLRCFLTCVSAGESNRGCTLKMFLSVVVLCFKPYVVIYVLMQLYSCMSMIICTPRMAGWLSVHVRVRAWVCLLLGELGFLCSVISAELAEARRKLHSPPPARKGLFQSRALLAMWN